MSESRSEIPATARVNKCQSRHLRGYQRLIHLCFISICGCRSRWQLIIKSFGQQMWCRFLRV